MAQPEPRAAASSPVQNPEPEKLEDGIALCLSGGGYRAMLFHVGAIWRLNELGYLPKLDRVSSVSGGSITAGTLGLNWPKLQFGERRRRVQPRRAVRRSAARARVDDDRQGLGLRGHPRPRDDLRQGRRRVPQAPLRRRDAAGPSRDGPRFVINATNVQTGALWRFSKPYMADYRVGMVRNPTVGLADRRRRLVGVPADPLAARTEGRPEQLRRRPADTRPTALRRRTRPTSC